MWQQEDDWKVWQQEGQEVALYDHTQHLPKKGPGRPKGSVNKSTKAAREFIAGLCDDPKIQAAVRRKVLKGDTVGFFKALDKIVPDAPKDVNIRGEFKMIEWPGTKDIAEE